MKKNSFDAVFWDNRDHITDTDRDISEVAPPIKMYIDQIKNRNLKILIPGAGNSYKAEYL